jgi:hypothetical protein
MTYEPLRELRITEPARLSEIVWFHDADFDADDIDFDATATLTIPFAQDVRQLPLDLPLPTLKKERRRWFGIEALVPYVECRLTVRRTLGFSLDGGEMTWGGLDDASFDEETRELTLEATFGPTIRVQVEALDVSVSASDHVRCYKRLCSSRFGEMTSGGIYPADVRD